MNRFRAWVIGGTLTFFAFAGAGFAVANAGDENEDPQTQTIRRQGIEWTIERGKTADGRSFGSENDPQYGYPMPDLVLTQATNGKVGYTSVEETEEALGELDAAKSAEGAMTIPVYAKDGVTVIGEYAIGLADNPDFKVVEKSSGR